MFYSYESVILFVVLFVALWLCYSVIKITQKVLDRFQSNLAGRLVIIKERSSSNLTKIASVEQEPRIGITKFFLGFLGISLQHPNIIKTKYVPRYFLNALENKGSITCVVFTMLLFQSKNTGC